MNYPFRSIFLAIAIFFITLQIISSIQSLSFLQSSKNSTSVTISSPNGNPNNFLQHQVKNSVISEIEINEYLDPELSQLPKKESFGNKKHNHLTNKLEAKNSANNAISQNEEPKKVIANPLPEIPEDMRYEAFNSMIVARFLVGKNGEVLKVDLVSWANNPRLNSLLIKSLKNWRFENSSKEFSVEIKVNFRVE